MKGKIALEEYYENPANDARWLPALLNLSVACSEEVVEWLPGRSRSECLHLRLDSLARTIGVIRAVPSGSAFIP